MKAVLWIYVVLLLAGGLMGYLKARSVISLVTSSIFAALLILSAVELLPMMVALIVLGFLAVFFGMRLARGGKFMPAGLMTILSLAALVALLILR